MNIAFISGQIGLALTAFFGIAVIQAMNQMKTRPPWFHVISIWVTAVGSMFAFSDAMVRAQVEELPAIVHWSRFAVGLCFLAGYLRYRYTRSRPLPKAVVNRINQIIFVATSLSIAVVLGYWRFGNKLDPHTQNQIDNLQSIAHTNRKIFLRDTVLTAHLKATVDSQNKQLAAYRLQIAQLTTQLKTANQNIERLTGIVYVLTKTIRKIDKNQAILYESVGDIKRNQAPKPIQPPQNTEFILPSEKVKPFKQKP